MVLGLGAVLVSVLTGASGSGRVWLEPPPGFEPLAGPLVEGSAALVPAIDGNSRGEVLQAFCEKRGLSSAVLVVGRVGERTGVGSEGSARLAAAVARHLRGALDFAEVTVEQPRMTGEGPARRVEVQARVGQGEGGHALRFAFWPAGPDTFVLVASRPDSRAGELDPQLDRAFERFRPPVSVPSGPPRNALGLVLAGLGATAGLWLWRRRRNPDPPEA